MCQRLNKRPRDDSPFSTLWGGGWVISKVFLRLSGSDPKLVGGKANTEPVQSLSVSEWCEIFLGQSR
jgi:hypothetical protein